MYIILFLKGLVIGLIMCAPIGPIAAMCIDRTLKMGTLHGVVSGLGSAVADVFYSLVAILGLGIISLVLVKEQILFRFFGGLFLVYIGLKKSLQHPSEKADSTGNIPRFIHAVEAEIE